MPSDVAAVSAAAAGGVVRRAGLVPMRRTAASGGAEARPSIIRIEAIGTLMESQHMKAKKHAFVPSVDGRLEDRIVLNGARGGLVVNLPGGGRSFVPKEAILTTRTYNNVLVNINRAVVSFGNSQGSEAAYSRLERQLGAQLGRLPYARRDGLIDFVNESVRFYAPSEARILYGDIRSTVVSYLSDKVLNGEAAIRNSGGHYFSNADIVGPRAAIFNQG